MALQFISGSSISARTGYIYETICAQAEKDRDRKYIFVVPEQATLQVQRELAAVHPRHVLVNIDVLSFGRLAQRVIEETGRNDRMLLNDTGKSMILRRVAEKESSHLETFGRNLNQRGFIQELKSVISEFYAYRISDQILEELLGKLSERGALKKKLSDINTVFRAFQKEMGEKYCTAEEMLSILAENIPESDLVRDSVIVLDGFTGFTPLQYQVLEQILQYARHVVCTVTEDEDGRRPELFAMSSEMKKKLTAIAQKNGISCGEKNNRYVSAKISCSKEADHIEKNIFLPEAEPWKGETDAVCFFSAANPGEELSLVLRKVLELVREKGLSYRDMAITAGDLSVYENAADKIFSEAGIPYFIDRKKGVMGNPLIQLIRNALKVVEEHMSYESVMSFLRNPFVKIEVSALDRLDNYLLAGGIENTARWQYPWVFPYDETSEEEREELNGLRETIFESFASLRSVWGGQEVNVREALRVLFEFITEYNVYDTLEEQKKYFRDRNEFYLESEYEQIYSKITALFDQTAELMGDQVIRPSELADILDSGFEELKVGFIPASADRLVIGDVMRTRLEHIKVLFVVGANDRLLPKVSEHGGILNDYDRELLRDQGIELALSARDEVFNQQYYLYLLLTKPTEGLFVSYSECDASGKALRPAHLADRLMKLFPDNRLKQAGQIYPGMESLVAENDGFLLMINGLRGELDGVHQSWWKDLYTYYSKQDDYRDQMKAVREALFYAYRTEKLDKKIAERLFGEQKTNSVSRLEKFAACPYAHFLTYGLKLKERRQFELQAADYGSLFHAAISHFFELIEKRGLDFRTLTGEERSGLAGESVAKAMEEYQTSIFDSSARNQSMADRIRRMTDRTLWALRYQWEQGGYTQTSHEHDFREHLGVSSEAAIDLAGRIDRIDSVSENGLTYVKVIDYKSGNTKLDLSRVYYGLQLQLVMYLEAALKKEEKRHSGEKVIPAGIYYYNMKDPIIDGYGLSEQEIEEKQQKELRMNGLSNSDDMALRLIDRDGGNVVYGLEYKKDGSLSSRAVTGTTQQMHDLCRYGRNKALKLTEQMFEGKIDAAPYEYKGQTPCTYCEYQSICGFDLMTEGCHFSRLDEIDQQEFWNKINKEKEEQRRPEDGGSVD